jgi:hypothetical protein
VKAKPSGKAIWILKIAVYKPAIIAGLAESTDAFFWPAALPPSQGKKLTSGQI